MKDTVAYRYALALYDLAKETNKIDKGNINKTINNIAYETPIFY